VLRYGTNTTPGTTNMSAAFQAAFDQQSVVDPLHSPGGGAPVYVPTGHYLITTTIATKTAAPFNLYGDGMGKTVIAKTGDSDCFVVTNSGSAFNQITISDLTITPGVAMTTGAALNLTCTGIIPSVTLRNVMVLCGGSSIGAQRVGREVLLPQARREFGDAARGVFADPLQHIDQIGIRVDAVESASHDQTLDDANVLCTEFGPAKVPGLSSHRDDAQRSLQVVRVDGYIRIGEKDFEPDAPLAHIVRQGACCTSVDAIAWHRRQVYGRGSVPRQRTAP
jgi:hypothetical protein